MDTARTVHRVRPSHISYAFLGAFLVSVFLLQWWHVEVEMKVKVEVFMGICILLGLATKNLQRRAHLLSVSIACAIGVTLAIITVSRTTHVPSPETIDTHALGKTVTVTGIITDAPDDRHTFINYTVNTTSLRITSTGSLVPVSGKILVKDMRRWPRFSYGDAIEIKGALDRPEATDTFAYDNYLSRFGIYATMRANTLSLVSKGNGNQIMTALITLRDHFESQINRVFGEPHAAFLAGLLTGSRSGMPETLTAAFKTTGLTHIVAISGFNITIIIAILSSCLFFLPLKWRFAPTIIAIILFTLFVGASASVVRASIMGILGLFALQTGRIRHARLAILWTACFMLLWNPKLLWYDAGFQLSFLAVIGLVETAPVLEKWLKHIPNILGIREALTMTIAAQIFAVPWIILQFGTLSLISPLANILVAPLIPLAMLFGFLGTVISFAIFPLGQLIGFAGWGCMELILIMTTALADIPYASVTISGASIFITSLYYTIIIATLIVINCTKKLPHH